MGKIGGLEVVIVISVVDRKGGRRRMREKLEVLRVQLGSAECQTS